MEKQLLQLSPRIRTTNERAQTLQHIQKRIQKEKRKDWLKLASSYIGVAALLFLLVASTVIPSSVTTSTGKEVKYVGYYVYEVTPWYNIGENDFLLNKEGTKIIAHLADLADKGEPFKLNEINWLDEYIPIPYYLGVTQHESESYSLLVPKDKSKSYFFENNTTKTFTSFDHDEFLDIYESIQPNSDDYKKLPISIRVLLIAFIYFIYLWISHRIHPRVRPTPLDKLSVGRTALKISGHLLAVFIFGFLVAVFTGSLNLFVIVFLITIGSIAKTWLENLDRYDKRSWLEVPFTIFVYTLSLFIMFY